MQITYTPVPAAALPTGVHALVVAGDVDLVCQMNEDASIEELADALTQVVTREADASWVRLPQSADWDRFRLEL